MEDAWGGIFGVAGGEELIVPGAGEMGEDDEEGCDTTEALLYSPKSIIIPKVNFDTGSARTSIHLTLFLGSPLTLGSPDCHGSDTDSGGRVSTKRE